MPAARRSSGGARAARGGEAMSGGEVSCGHDTSELVTSRVGSSGPCSISYRLAIAISEV